jgi:acetylornithine deacetylase
MKTLDLHTIRKAVDSRLPEAERFLCDLIRRPSLSGQEAEVMEVAFQRFSELAATSKISLTNTLRQDEDYANPIEAIQYDGRWQIRTCLAGKGDGQSLLLNTHLDVVPPSPGQEQPFDPVVKDGVVTGRGACDAKGQVATIFLALAALHDLEWELAGDLIAHLVVEEENGGNGTLAMIRGGEKAAGCIVLEPTELRVLTSVRGAVWFRVILTGRSGHSGRAGDSVSALRMAVRVMEIFEKYQARLLNASRGIALFDGFPNPMPITFGKLNAGNWPATAPGEAILEGVLGFLPNKTRCQVMQELHQAIQEEGDEWLRTHCQMEFLYRHDSHVLKTDHPLVGVLQSCSREAGVAGEIAAMTASCDSWFYNNQLQIPTVVFGPGSLGLAHTNHEQISMQDIATAATILVQMAGRWCR